MTSAVKLFIELYVELLDNGTPDLFFERALEALDHSGCEELIHILNEVGIDTPKDVGVFLMKAALNDETRSALGVTSERGKWARWMSYGYEGDYKDWARVALECRTKYNVYHAPYGWEGDCEDYLILDKRISLGAFIRSENREIYDQTGEPGPFNIQDFKLVTTII